MNKEMRGELEERAFVRKIKDLARLDIPPPIDEKSESYQAALQEVAIIAALADLLEE